MSRETVPRQLLHLVFGGELTELDALQVGQLAAEYEVKQLLGGRLT